MTNPAVGYGEVAEHVFITGLNPSQAQGSRLAVKDCIDVAGTVTSAGSPVVAEIARLAQRDASCLTGARAAGARIVGKTNLHELCFGATGVNPHFGTPSNPLDPARIPGGSSSGSAVAVATGVADVALGTDTAGSIRNPAACCGVVGLKTTFGRIPVTGTRPLAPSLDTIGPLARDVAGIAVGMSLLERDFTTELIDDARAIRIGRFRGIEADLRIDASVDAVLEAVACDVVDVDLPGWHSAHEDTLTLMYAEALEVNALFWNEHRDRLGHDVRERFTVAETISGATIAAVRARRHGWQAALAGALDGLDAIVTVGYPRFPPRLDAIETASNPAAAPVNLSGFPALCLPVASVGGPITTNGRSFPASMQLIGPPGAEEHLVGLGSELELAARS